MSKKHKYRLDAHTMSERQYAASMMASSVTWLASMLWGPDKLPFREAKRFVEGAFKRLHHANVEQLFAATMSDIEKVAGPLSSRAIEDLKIMRRGENMPQWQRDSMVEEEDRHPDDRMPRISAVFALGAFEPTITPQMRRIWPVDEKQFPIPALSGRLALLTAAVGLIAAVEKIDRAEAKLAGKALSPVWSKHAGRAVSDRKAKKARGPQTVEEANTLDGDDICPGCGKTKRECREAMEDETVEMPSAVREMLADLFR